MQVDLDKISKWNKVFENNPLVWGFVFLNDYFRDQPAEFHVELILAAQNYNELAIAAPRGHAKSTIISFLYVIHSLYYKKKHNIMIVGNTQEKASDNVKAISREIKTNEHLKMFYGDLSLLKDSVTTIETEHEDGYATRVLAIGAEQIGGYRGTKFRAYRPDLIIMDDLEDDELVQSSDRREKLKNDVDSALIPMGDKNTQYIAVGTILHFASQMSRFLSQDEYTSWKKMFYQAITNEKTHEVLWEDCRNFIWLDQKRKNDPVAFAKEYMNNPVSGEQARFNISDFRYYKHEGEQYTLLNKDNEPVYRGNYSDCIPAISCDLAWSDKRTADYSVIFNMLLDPNGNYIVYKYIAERGMRPERLANILFGDIKNLERLTGTRPAVGFEKAIIEKVQQHFLKHEMRRRNEHFIVKPLRWDSDKITRIEVGLEPLYSNNLVFHRRNMTELEDELFQFPFSAHDDVIDAEQGAVQLLKFPKKVKKPTPAEEDPMFEWVKKNMVSSKKSNPRRVGEFLFGKRSNINKVDARQSFMGR